MLNGQESLPFSVGANSAQIQQQLRANYKRFHHGFSYGVHDADKGIVKRIDPDFQGTPFWDGYIAGQWVIARIKVARRLPTEGVWEFPHSLIHKHGFDQIERKEEKLRFVVGE